MATSQTLSPVDHVVEPNARTAIDQLGIVMTNAGIAANGTITGGAFNGTVGATTASSGVFTTLSASSGLDTTVIGANTPEAITGTTITGTVITASTDFVGPTSGVTNGSSAASGIVGQFGGGSVFGTATTATVTITITAPGVITWTSHGFSTVLPQPVVFTTSGALPTGITSGTTYYTVPTSVTTNTFQIATTVVNALASTSITTSGTQSGTQTGTAGCTLTSTVAANVTGISVPAGDWDIWGQVAWNAAATCSATIQKVSINTASATLAGPGTVSGGSEKDWLATAQVATNGLPTIEVPTAYITVATTTSVFLVVNATFSAGLLGAYGFIAARRRR